jgi:thiamine biosynthesis lipoprotein
MALSESVQCCVNAGGDLRLAGPRPERILLRDTGSTGEEVPMIELENGSLASSSGRASGRIVAGHRVGPHLNAVSGGAVGGRSFVSVAAESCMTADALTKIVLARRAAAQDLLRRHGATAYLHTPRGGWRILGEAA